MSNTKELLKVINNALEDKMAQDINILDVNDISSLSKYFVIANGNNSNQVKAMAAEVEEKVTEYGQPLLHMEGYRGSDWILMDFGDVIVHIFDKESRTFYSLEKIWEKGKPVDPTTL